MKQIAKSKLRRLPAHNQSFARTDCAIGDSVLSYEVAFWKCGPRRRCSAIVLGIDASGITANCQGQAFQVARYCVHKRVDPKNVGEVQWTPDSDRSEEMEVWPSSVLGKRGGGDAAQLARRMALVC